MKMSQQIVRQMSKNQHRAMLKICTNQTRDHSFMTSCMLNSGRILTTDTMMGCLQKWCLE